MKWHRPLTFKIVGYTLVVALITLLGREVGVQRVGVRTRAPASNISSTCMDLLSGLISEVGVRDNFKARYLKKFSKLAGKERVKARDIDELVDLLAREARPKLADHLSLRQLEVTLTREALLKEMLTKGVRDALISRGINVREQGVFAQFFTSKAGEFVKTSFGALGVPWGLPPLYLPGGKLVALSDEQLSLFTQLPFAEAFDQYILSLGQSELSHFQQRALYHYMREHYMRFASLVSTLLSAYWFYESYQGVNEEAQMLEEMEAGAQKILEGVSYFEQQGISLSGVDSAQSGRPRECLFIDDCVSSQGVSSGDADYHDYFHACVDFLKMGRECQIK